MFPHQVGGVSTRRRHHGLHGLPARGYAARPLGSLWVLAFLVGLGSPAGPRLLGRPSLLSCRRIQVNQESPLHQVGQVNRYLIKYNIISEIYYCLCKRTCLYAITN